MFDDDQALIGYTRQKFNERAMLAYASFDRVRKRPALFDRLLKTRQICSIGCGPGCEVIGALCFLILSGNSSHREFSSTSTSSSSSSLPPGRTQATREEVRSDPRDHRPALDRVVLVDYVMPQWKRLVIDSLVPLISPRCVGRISSHRADVRLPLLLRRHQQEEGGGGEEEEEEERGASRWRNDGEEEEEDAAAARAKNDDTNEGLLVGKNAVDFGGLDLVMVSYLLTETRGNWKEFFGGICDRLRSGTLVFLCEPTAWQLHSFLAHFSGSIASHLWLDSSRDEPELQLLDARMGPAVVLVEIK